MYNCKAWEALTGMYAALFWALVMEHLIGGSTWEEIFQLTHWTFFCVRVMLDKKLTKKDIDNELYFAIVFLIMVRLSAMMVSISIGQMYAVFACIWTTKKVIDYKSN